ncbi:hypothetical protein BDFG_01020 [Blastomyces dermatitidis ATCC 26199]|nr:hypothetical protein BDFG_01020 [Blastomyces dermatitidis ATCC 26199]
MTSNSPYFNANGNRGRLTSKSTQQFSKRNGDKRNTSILNFFKKSDTPPKASQNRITNYIVRSNNNEEKSTSATDIGGSESLFFGEEVGQGNILGHHIEHLPGSDSPRLASPPSRGFWETARIFDDGDRYNENYNTGQKRQRVGNTDHAGTTAVHNDAGGSSATSASRTPRIGPFLDESDSEQEYICEYNKKNVCAVSRTKTLVREIEYDGNAAKDSSNDECDPNSTMIGVDFATASDFLPNYKGSDTSELREVEGLHERPLRKYDEQLLGLGMTTSIEKTDLEAPGLFDDKETVVCPICSERLIGIADDDVSLHVNSCLDGNLTTIPSEIRTPTIESKSDISMAGTNKAVIPRPGQRNPFTVESKGKESSAFSKIMSGNAEDAAWAAAAAKEEASRGKQAFERTCPFYKILPGFSICVDAFRYGAVEGCRAYFLSHFHSDHYIGLTSSWCHGQIYCSTVTGNLVRQQLKVDPKWITDIDFDKTFEIPQTNGAWVTMLPANHCPGSSIFLFEKQVNTGPKPRVHRILHCGDFRACPAHVQHPLLRPDVVDSLTGKVKQQLIDVCYLDTTYLNPKYAFPNQDDVVAACAAVCADLDPTQHGDSDDTTRGPTTTTVKTVMDLGFNAPQAPTRLRDANSKSRGRLLVVIGTYSIGKERLCMAIARALNCKIYAPAAKQRICACLEDAELSRLLTNNPIEAQVHMQTLMEVRAETLLDYLNSLKPHFSRVVGFRPTGWNYRPPAGRMTDSPPVSSVLYSDSWKPRFGTKDLIPQRGSNRQSTCYSVPYSEHSSFRELTMFCCALRIAKVIPTVNVGSKRSREKMKLWVEKWEAEKRKNGLFKVDNEATRCDGISMMSLPPLERHSQIYGLCINAGEEDDIDPWTVLIRMSIMTHSYLSAVASFNTRDRAEHARKRKTVAHTFSAKSIGKFEQYIHANLKEFVRQWNRISDMQRNPKTGYASIDALHWFNYVAFDIIGDLAFGSPFGMLEKGRFFIDSGEVSATLGVFPTLKPWAKFLPDRFFLDGLEAVEELAGIAVARVSERLRPEAIANNTREDLLARLMEGRDEAGAKLGREELTAEALTQLIAGSDTTSNTACAILYWVLRTPGFKEKLQQILDNVIPSDVKVPPYSMVKDIQYLSWVISEIHSTSSLGLPRLIPEGASPIRIHDRVFRPGTVLSVPSYTIHPSTRIWGPDAEEFVPTRWDPARLTSEQKAALIPFNTGPRACVGRNVAEMELQCMAATVFKNFDFELQQEGPLETRDGFLRKPLELCVGIKRRQAWTIYSVPTTCI